MSYLTDMDKHARALRQMQKLQVTRIVKLPDGFSYYCTNRLGNRVRRTMPNDYGGKWVLALQYVDGAEAGHNEWSRKTVFTLNHDRIRGALVHYDEARAAMAEVQ